MKRIKRIIIFLIFTFIFIPIIKVEAATSLSSSNQNPVVGSTIDINLTIDYGKSQTIKSAHYIINYDATCFNLQEVIWTQSRGTYKNQSGNLSIDKSNSTSPWQAGSPVIARFKVIKTCRSEFKLNTNGDAINQKDSVIHQTISGVTINSVQGNSDTYLNTLSVKNYELSPVFDKSVNYYSLTVPADVEQVEIIAKKANNKQTISGDGIKNLNYGDNRININVKAESGATNTYTIMIHRNDNRTSETALKALSVSNTNIKYSKDKDVYEATVSKSISNVFITARTADSKAQLTGTGKKDLKIGVNTFEIKVTATNGVQKIYKIIITRSTQELQADIESTKLLSLNINNQNIDLKKSVLRYLIGVDKTISKLNITYVTESKTATVKITGNDNLKSGFNTVTITVTEKNNQSEKYKIIVYKEPDNFYVLEGIDAIKAENLKEKTIIYINESDLIKISKEQINIIKESKKEIYLNIVNNYHGLLYQIKINASIPSKDLELFFKKISSTPITFNTSIPAGIEVILYLDTDLYKDGTSLFIYTYNNNGSYTLLSEGVTIDNGYVTFISNGDKNYVFTTQTLIEEESFFQIIFRKYKVIIIIALIIICIIIISAILINKKIKEKEMTEPLY